MRTNRDYSRSKHLCACTGRKCEGECRSLHLHRKREHLSKILKHEATCPAAYLG